jgi:hypothetical protein
MRAILALLFLPFLAGCSAGNNVSFGSTTGAGGTGTHTETGGHGTGGSGTGGHGQGGGFMIDAGPIPDGGPMVPAEVFGQTATTLYKLDPVTKVVTLVGDFQGCNGSVIDIALDKDGNMFGTTFVSAGVYKIDKTTAACTLIRADTNPTAYPNSLSFVPVGTALPNAEALVGYDFSNNYIRIDTTTGVITIIGSGILSPYTSSGDIVSVIGGGTYLTVKGGPENCSDCIVEVNPTTGAIKKMIGPVLHTNVYGLAFWGGSAYGFDDSGALFQIDLTNGMPTAIPIPNAPPGLSWYGAGSTTSAPLTPTQ